MKVDGRKDPLTEAVLSVAGADIRQFREDFGQRVHVGTNRETAWWSQVRGGGYNRLPSRVHSSDVTNTAAWWPQVSDPTASQGQRNCWATPQGLTADQRLGYDMTRDSLGTVMRDEINRQGAQLVELRKCNANQAEQIRHMSAAFTALAGQLIAAEAEDRRLRALLNRVEDAPADPIQSDIERTIDHLLNGRTTTDRRRGLNTATERAERVKPDGDAAVGRAIG